jgi:hypothetical protein
VEKRDKWHAIAEQSGRKNDATEIAKFWLEKERNAKHEHHKKL